MPRTALSVAAGVAVLLVVSIGLCQTLPRSAPPSHAPAPIVQPPMIQPPVAPAYPHPVVQAPIGPTHAVLPVEKMTVKVYSVPDLVAAIQLRSPTPSPFAMPPEIAAAMQQVQLQVQMAQSATQPDAPDEVTLKLERLKKAVSVAAPRKSWTEEGGEGEIEVYPEALCLIVRQTASGHEAISDLLTQLRATQNIQIELAIEMMTFDGIADEKVAEVMKLLNREMSAEEVAQFRQCGLKSALSSVVHMANGRCANAGLAGELPLQFTAVTGEDRRVVEFRSDLAVPVGSGDAGEMAVMLQSLSQTRSVTVGKAIAFVIGAGDGFGVILVTPKVIDRTAESTK